MYEIIENAPEWWLAQPWPLPEPMTAEQYQREAIAGAHDAEPQVLEADGTYCKECE